MRKLGTEQCPVIVKTYSEQRAEKIASICEQYGFIFIIGLEKDEDITDLKKAIKHKMAPNDVYDLCLCGSGKKYKYCCFNKEIDIDL